MSTLTASPSRTSTFLGRLGVLILVYLASLVAACSDKDSTATKVAPAKAPTATPVFIYVIDTLRADRLSIYGYDRAITPNFEALARESVVFDQAYSAAPWTLPSIASLVTSKWPCEHDVNHSRQRLHPKHLTLAERLRGIGYRTGAFFNNPFAGQLGALDRGYEQAVLAGTAGTPDVLNSARKFLDASAGQPFFAYLHTTEPHQPFYTPYEYSKPFGHFPVEEKEGYFNAYNRYRSLRFVDYSANKPLGTTDNTSEQNDVRKELERMLPFVNSLYDASVHWADGNLGLFITDLKKRGLWDQSVVIVLSDHGEEFNDHGDWYHDQSVYEELIRVPLLIHMPGGRNGGQRVGNRVSLIDIAPTILALLGRGELCDGCRGKSIVPLLEGLELDRDSGTEPLAVRINASGYYRPVRELRGDVNVAMRRGDAKAIWNEDPQRTELYDLSLDATERNDLGGTDAVTTAELTGEAINWLQTCREAALGAEEIPALDERTRERLRAIGYLN